MLAKAAGDQRTALRGEFNPAHAAVVGVVFARDEPFFNEPIHGHANGSGREPDLWANRIHRERAFMQENFQDAEIGVAQFCPLDALGGVREQSLKGFHENEPDVNAGGVLPWSCSFPSHSKLYLDTDCIDVNILYIKQQKLT